MNKRNNIFRKTMEFNICLQKTFYVHIYKSMQYFILNLIFKPVPIYYYH